MFTDIGTKVFRKNIALQDPDAEDPFDLNDCSKKATS